MIPKNKYFLADCSTGADKKLIRNKNETNINVNNDECTSAFFIECIL
jgi:hypothetical protein